MGTFPTNKSLVNQGLHSWGVVCGACVSPVCVHVWSPVCVRVDARGHCPLSSSVVFYLIFLRQSFTGLGLLAWLDFGSVGWPVSSEDHLSLPSEGYHRTQIFACFWGIQTQLLTLTLHLPNHPRSVAYTHLWVRPLLGYLKFTLQPRAARKLSTFLPPTPGITGVSHHTWLGNYPFYFLK